MIREACKPRSVQDTLIFLLVQEIPQWSKVLDLGFRRTGQEKGVAMAKILMDT